jgi:nitric oxide synthase-interacting protein
VAVSYHVGECLYQAASAGGMRVLHLVFWLCPAGDVVMEETYKACIKPEGEFKGKKVTEKDIIRLQTGGTGFAARDGDKVQVKKHFHLGPGSGRADLRGQHQGPRSHFGLQFYN